MHERRRRTAAVLAMIAAVTTTACSGSGSRPAPSHSTSGHGTSPLGAATTSPTPEPTSSEPASGPAPSFVDELKLVPLPSATTHAVDVDYIDLSALRSAGVITGGSSTTASTVAPAWTNLVQSGLGAFSSAAAVLPRITGLNPLLADVAEAYQQDSSYVTRLSGSFTAATISTRLLALGARTRTFGNAAGLSFGADNSKDTTSALQADLGNTNPLLQWLVSPTSILSSQSGATLTTLRSTRKSISTVAQVRQVAACLGDVVAAEIRTPVDSRDSTRLIAAGVMRSTSADGGHREVMCALPKPGDAARVRQAFTARLATTSPDVISSSAAGAVLGATVSNSSVDVSGALVRVRLTLRSGTDAGYLIGGLQSDTQLYWAGSCPVAAIRDPSLTC